MIRLPLFFLCVLLSFALNAQEEQPTYPVEFTPSDTVPTKASEEEDLAPGIMTRLVAQDYIDPVAARWILAHRAAMLALLSKVSEEMNKVGNPQVARRLGLWSAVLSGSPIPKNDLPSDSQELVDLLSQAQEIGEVLRPQGSIQSPFELEQLKSWILGDEPACTAGAARVAVAFKLSGCAGALRQKLAVSPPQEVEAVAGALAELEPAPVDVAGLIQRLDAEENEEERHYLLDAMTHYLASDATKQETALALEERILKSKELQNDSISLWAEVASVRSRELLLEAAQKLSSGEQGAAATADQVWAAICRVTPREELATTFQSIPQGVSPQLAMCEVYDQLAQNPLPALAEQVGKWLASGQVGLGSVVTAFLLDCTGEEGLKVAEKEIVGSGAGVLEVALEWKKRGLTLEVFAKELAAATNVSPEPLVSRAANLKAAAVKRQGGPVLDAALAVPLLLDQELAVQVKRQSAYIPVEYVDILNLFVGLVRKDFPLFELNQRVDGIEQLGDLNPLNPVVPKTVKLRYFGMFSIPGYDVEFRPRDMYDLFDLAEAARAINEAAEKLGKASRMRVLGDESAMYSVIVYGVPEKMNPILDKFLLEKVAFDPEEVSETE